MSLLPIALFPGDLYSRVGRFFKPDLLDPPYYPVLFSISCSTAFLSLSSLSPLLPLSLIQYSHWVIFVCFTEYLSLY